MTAAPIGPGEPRARARLGVALAVYAVHAFLAVTLALPTVGLVRSLAGSLPHADAALFEPGGLHLGEVIRSAHGVLAGVAEQAAWIALASAYLGLLPLGALLFALARPGKLTLADLSAGGARLLGPLTLLLGVSLLADLAAVGLPALVGALLSTKLDAIGFRAADVGRATVGVTCLALVLVVGVVHDVCRATAAWSSVSGAEAIRLGLAVFGARPLAALAGWASRGVLALALVLGGAAIAHAIGVETGARTALVALIHQLIALALVLLRASWLAAALRLVRERREVSEA